MGQREEVGRRGFCKAAVTLVGAAALAGAAGARAAGMGAQQVGLGPSASLGGKRVFPADNPWNQDISELPADPNSDVLIRSIGLDKHLHPDFGTVYQGAPVGIPYVVVPGTQPKVPVRFQYADESNPGPYPIPLDAPIEGGPKSEGDRHVLVIDRNHWKLYELFAAYPEGKGWRAAGGAIFDLNSNALRPAGWSSADAAGLPVFPGLVPYDEVIEQGAIRHAPLHVPPHASRLRAPRPALCQPAHRPGLAADGDACPAEGVLRHLQISAHGANDSDGTEAIRDVPGRQRQRLVPERSARPALGRRGTGNAQAGQGAGP